MAAAASLISGRLQLDHVIASRGQLGAALVFLDPLRERDEIRVLVAIAGVVAHARMDVRRSSRRFLAGHLAQRQDRAELLDHGLVDLTRSATLGRLCRPRGFRRIRLDTLIGMAFSNLIALSIMITTATTLHAHGHTDIQSSSQAAEALKPLAGPLAELIFALGIIGTGLLAIPVLAGSTAYAVAEGRKWPVGLARKPKEAIAFYVVLAISGLLGIALDFAPLNPIKALYWSAVINGVLAAPVMIVLMILVRRQKVMGNFVVSGWLYWLGWASTVAMALCIVGMGIGLLSG